MRIQFLMISAARHNGYFLCKGKLLKDFKLRFAKDIDFPTKITFLGLFDFRSFFNYGMLWYKFLSKDIMLK